MHLERKSTIFVLIFVEFGPSYRLTLSSTISTGAPAGATASGSASASTSAKSDANKQVIMGATGLLVAVAAGLQML